jgi:hypothetical protein
VKDLSRMVEAYGYQADSAYTMDAGYGFGAVCKDANGACENVARFEVYFKDITVSWFQP